MGSLQECSLLKTTQIASGVPLKFKEFPLFLQDPIKWNLTYLNFRNLRVLYTSAYPSEHTGVMLRHDVV